MKDEGDKIERLNSIAFVYDIKEKYMNVLKVSENNWLKI